MHTLVGTFLTIGTVIWILKTLQFTSQSGQFHASTHSIFGLILLAFVIVVYATGFIGALLGRFKIFYKPWQHHKEVHNKILKFHSIAGKLNVLWAYATTTLGLIAY